MQIETKFGIGDTAWLIRRQREQYWIPCGFCGETGRIEGKDGVDRSCPVCAGRKGSQGLRNMEWRVVQRLTIGQVQSTTTSTRYTDEDMNYDHREHCESYMCHETGVFSGSRYYIQDMWPTKTTAEAECKRRNDYAIANEPAKRAE